MAYLSFDEINSLGYKRRSEPLEHYFDVMDIPKAAANRRVAIARRIKKVVVDYLKVIDDYIETLGDYAFDIAERYLRDGLREAIEDSGHEIDDYLAEYIEITVFRINDVSRRRIKPTVANNETTTAQNGPTFDEPEDEMPDESAEKKDDEDELLPYYMYFDSEDRAEFIAEDEANSIEGYEDFLIALMRGFTVKTWNTMQDKRVRETHVQAEGQTVPIGAFFSVGNASLMFPRDTVNGADYPEELVNCRCWLTFGG